MNPLSPRPMLTLEPLMDAVQEGVEADGWRLSGIQKTTSHQFEGRWAGGTSRSAYLFFHLPAGPEWAGLEVFLDETNEALQGNFALVVDGCALSRLGDATAVFGALGPRSVAHLPRGYRTPLTLRLRLEDGAQEPGSATSEIRFKLVIPRRTLDEGSPSVVALASEVVKAFRKILADPALVPFLRG